MEKFKIDLFEKELEKSKKMIQEILTRVMKLLNKTTIKQQMRIVTKK